MSKLFFNKVHVLDAVVCMAITAVLLVFTCSNIKMCCLVPYFSTTFNLQGDAGKFFNHPAGQLISNASFSKKSIGQHHGGASCALLNQCRLAHVALCVKHTNDNLVNLQTKQSLPVRRWTVHSVFFFFPCHSSHNY